MGPEATLINPNAVTGWLAVAQDPLIGAFCLGLLLGSLIGIWLWNKYVVKPSIAMHETSCTEKLAQLQKELDEVKGIAMKWNNFMERKALEALGGGDYNI